MGPSALVSEQRTADADEMDHGLDVIGHTVAKNYDWLRLVSERVGFSVHGPMSRKILGE